MRPAAANRNRRDRQAPLQRACRSLSCVWKERNICFVRTLFAFARREAVLTISFCCALLSMLAVPPDAGYADYIDLRVLCLLFCLMAVVAGLQQCGLFALLALLCGLFALCLLSVVHVLHYLILTAIVALCLLLCARGLFRQVDYALLATFVCFFVFAGNVGRIEAVRAALESLMRAGAYGTSLLASQVISNVPAAVLLAGFTDNWRALLAGVNIGGLGTPLASLASRISLKLYLRAEHASLPRYLAVFTAANAAGLAVLSAAAALLGLL